jgi:hypothetical protein
MRRRPTASCTQHAHRPYTCNRTHATAHKIAKVRTRHEPDQIDSCRLITRRGSQPTQQFQLCRSRFQLRHQWRTLEHSPHQRPHRAGDCLAEGWVACNGGSGAKFKQPGPQHPNEPISQTLWLHDCKNIPKTWLWSDVIQKGSWLVRRWPSETHVLLPQDGR